MKWSVSCALLLLGCAFASAIPARFDNHKVYNVAIETEEQLTALSKLSQRYSFTFFDVPSKIGQSVEVVVSPDQKPLFEGILENLSLKPTLLVDNLQSLLDNEQVFGSRAAGDYDLEQYHRLDDIYAWLDSLPEQYPGIVTRIKGGDTYEGRSIEGVKLSVNPENPGIFIEANIHAREWITSATTNWIINELLTSTDPEVQALLNNYNWYIFPVTNPDGYEYTHTDYRLWRKTRSRNGLICFGTDPNRNFGYNWEIDGVSASDDPCSDIYGGSAPFSEIETKTLSDYVLSLGPGEIKAYLAFHSAANMIMFPWGFTSELVPDHDNQMAIVRAAYERLYAVSGTVYTYGNSHDTIYKTTGSSQDWSYGALGAKIGLTYEFRNKDNNGNYYGFQAPPSEIKPNSIEILQSIIGLTLKGEELGYFGRK